MEKEKFCAVMIRNLHNQLEKQMNNAMQSMDITISQAGILAAVMESPEGKLTMKELEQTRQLSQSVTAGIVFRLEQKGLLESYGDPADKRIKIVKVTRQGEAHCEAARDIIVRMENKMLAGMTEEDIDTLWTLLSAAFNNMT